MASLTDQPIDVRALRESVMRRSDGAAVTFEGVVRDHHEGRAVTSLEYEAYRPMAESEMARIIDETHARHPGVAVAVLHRLGHLDIGDVAVAIVAVAPHRALAFEVCREVIDRIKETVPIWKKEYGPDGETWVGWQGRTAEKANA